MILMRRSTVGRSFDYDDPRDYEEWCAWNDVDEDEGYYVPCGWRFFPRGCLKWTWRLWLLIRWCMSLAGR